MSTHVDRHLRDIRKHQNEGGDTAIAAVWLVFYAVAITAAVVAPVFLRAIDIAAVH